MDILFLVIMVAVASQGRRLAPHVHPGESERDIDRRRIFVRVSHLICAAALVVLLAQVARALG